MHLIPAMRLSLFALCCCGLLAACSGRAAPLAGNHAEAVATPALIPAPASLVPREGSFRFDRTTHLHAEGGVARNVAAGFSAMVEASHGFAPVLAADGTAGAIRFAIDPAISPGAPEGYLLEVGPEGVDGGGREFFGDQHDRL